MGKTKLKTSKKTRRKEGAPASLASVLQNIAKHEQHQQATNVDVLIEKAHSRLTEESNAPKALSTITQALGKNPTSLKALELAGEINVELGDIATAIQCFTNATQLDTDGSQTGAEKFLWLAQLCEEGGEAAIAWYEKGVDILRTRYASPLGKPDEKEAIQEKLCSALCGMAELFMTDLWYVESNLQSFVNASNIADLLHV